MRLPEGAIAGRTPGGRGGPPLAYVNARLLDPATKLDTLGGLIVRDGLIADLGPHLAKPGALAATKPGAIPSLPGRDEVLELAATLRFGT